MNKLLHLLFPLQLLSLPLLLLLPLFSVMPSVAAFAGSICPESFVRTDFRDNLSGCIWWAGLVRSHLLRTPLMVHDAAITIMVVGSKYGSNRNRSGRWRRTAMVEKQDDDEDDEDD